MTNSETQEEKEASFASQERMTGGLLFHALFNPPLMTVLLHNTLLSFGIMLKSDQSTIIKSCGRLAWPESTWKQNETLLSRRSQWLWLFSLHRSVMDSLHANPNEPH